MHLRCGGIQLERTATLFHGEDRSNCRLPRVRACLAGHDMKFIAHSIDVQEHRAIVVKYLEAVPFWLARMASSASPHRQNSYRFALSNLLLFSSSFQVLNK